MDGLDILVCINSLGVLLKAYILVCRACHSYRPHPLKCKGLNPENNLWLKLVQKLPEVTVQSSKSIQQYSQKTWIPSLNSTILLSNAFASVFTKGMTQRKKQMTL